MTRSSLLIPGLVFAIGMTLAEPARAESNSAAAPTGAETVLGANAAAFSLENGMEVVVLPDHRAPIVTHMVWYKVGGADELPGQSGVAHFLEHMMFMGTDAHPPGEFERVVAEIGGQQNAFTSQDYTAYFQVTAREHLPLMMEYESDRMANLVLNEEIVAPERQVILEERSSNVGNSPSAQLDEIINTNLFVNHPYSTPIVGWADEIQQLTVEDAVSFYEKHYTPNNAILVVAGDVEADEVRQMAQATYGKIKRRAEAPDRDRPKARPLIAEHTVSYSDERVRQPSTEKYWIVPGKRTSSGKDSLALSVLANVLSSGATGRLYKSLIVEKQIATSASAWYQGTALDDSHFGVYASPNGDTSLAELQAALQEEINLIAEHGVTEDELDRAKRDSLADIIFSQDSQRSIARRFGAALASGLSLEEVQYWPERMLSVTSEDVRAVAEKYLVGRGAVIGNLTGPT